MSSVQNKDVSLEKKVLQRKSSFQRIKCHARSALIGSIFSKDSTFIHLLENALNSSRAFVQKPAIVLVIPAVHILCVAMALCVNLIRKLTGGVSFEKLDNLIVEINILKSKHQSYSVRKAIEQRLAQDVDKQTSETKQDETRVESSSVFDRLAIRKELRQKEEESPTNNFLLQVSTFAAVSLAHLQLVFLVYLAGCSQLRPGYVFLLVCILSISFFVFKISFMKKYEQPKRVNRQHQASNRELYAAKSTKAVLSEIQSHSQKIENCLGKVKLL